MKPFAPLVGLILVASGLVSLPGPVQAEPLSCKALRLAIVARVKVAQDALDATQGMENQPLAQGFAEQIKQAASFATIYQAANCSAAELQRALDGVYANR